MALVITDRFKRAYRRLPADVQRKVKKALSLLADDPTYPSLRVHKIQGTDRVFEARVDRRLRISFHTDGTDIVLRNVDDHDECLKNP
jgi:mRNA-degrading endonuclease RelE of RelBE toxin-antitoxin system